MAKWLTRRGGHEKCCRTKQAEITESSGLLSIGSPRISKSQGVLTRGNATYMYERAIDGSLPEILAVLSM